MYNIEKTQCIEFVREKYLQCYTIVHIVVECKNIEKSIFQKKNKH